jgi:hypothetical protein
VKWMSAELSSTLAKVRAGSCAKTPPKRHFLA